MDSNNISASSKTSGAKLATNLVGKFRNSFSGKKRPVSSSKPMEHSPSFNSESTGAPTDNLYFQPSPLLFNNKEEEEKREDDLPDFALHPLWGDRSPLLTTKYRASTGSFSSSPLVLGTSAAPQPPRERRSSKTSSVLHRMVRRASSSSTSKRPPPPELVGLIGKLRQRLQEFETPLQMTELDLERLLDDNGFGLELAVQDFVERAQLRQYKPGSTLTRVMGDSPGLVNAWSSCDASVFKLRCGPRYRELKLKKPSGKETLYEVIAVDMFAGVPLKEEHLSRYLNLTELERENNNSHPLPNLFIGNFMLPLNEPKMFGSVDNGPTVHFHLVMRLSAWAKANPDHYAVKLAAKLLGGGDSDQQQIAMKERLKIIVQVANPNELQLGKMERGLCNKYNSLPFLYRAYNSRYHRGYPGWFQADFDGHRSGYATRMARHSLMHLSDSIVANVAFLVEGETDDELPEVLLGCATVHRLQCRSAKALIRPIPIYPLLSKPLEDL